MGTPEFAVSPLKKLVENGFHIVAVVTAPDRPTGRGQKIRESAVKKYAVTQNIDVLQPKNLKDASFVQRLADMNADLQVVVAFRMLPEIVWDMPSFGTFNLHASLLPQYRGAAPIQRVIMNGEEETGLTTFFLNHDIDTGDIIFQEKISIADDETAGTLHDKMLPIGSRLVLKTVESIAEGKVEIKQQSNTILNLKEAPKIYRADCEIKWNTDSISIYNHIRGLSPYPGAFTFIEKEHKKLQLKIFQAKISNRNVPHGKIETDNKHYIYIGCKNGAIELNQIQLEGKKRMTTQSLLQGFDISQFYLAF